MIEIINRETIKSKLAELRQEICESCANQCSNTCRYCALGEEKTVWWTGKGFDERSNQIK